MQNVSLETVKNNILPLQNNLLPRNQMHALIADVAEAKVHALKRSKIAIFRRREKLIRFVYKCMPQIFKPTTKQQDSWYEIVIS